MVNRRAFTAAVRRMIAESQGWRCRGRPQGQRGPYCNADLLGQPFEVDHIHALVHGGDNAENNYRALCIPCHRKKSAQDLKDRAKINRITGKTKGPPKRNWPTGPKLQSRGFQKRPKP